MDTPATRTFQSGQRMADAEATVVHRRPGAASPSSSILDADRSTLSCSERFGTPERPLPAMIGAYHIMRELGSGGMGVVYEGFDPRLKRRAAIKMIRAGLSLGADVLRRFQTEAEAVAQSQHPNIVQIYEVGLHDNQPFVALEFLGGGSLYSQASNKPQPPTEAAATVRVLAEAMQHAHQSGVIHRDLKPANVLFNHEGVAKVTDFGAARLTLDSSRSNGDSAVTQVGEVIGTPQYMAPEQARGTPDSITPAVDVYALGAMLYHLLTGRPPHDGPDSYDVLTAVLKNDPVPPRRLVPRVPRDLETICLKALEKAPGNRYHSAEAMADDLRRFLAGDSIAARPDPSVVRLWKKARRRPAIAGLLAGIVMVAVAGLAGILWQLDEATRARQDAEANAAVALANAGAAQHEQRAADQARLQAIDARKLVESERDSKDRSLYRSQISKVALMFDSGEMMKGQELLVESMPPEGGIDSRGWEWYHMARLGRNLLWRSSFQSRETPDAFWPACMAVSPDGRRVAVSGGNPYLSTDAYWDLFSPAQLFIVDITTGRVLHHWHDYAPEKIVSLRWLDDERLLVVPYRREVSVVNPYKQMVLNRWEMSEGPVFVQEYYSSQVSENGKVVARAIGMRGFGLWDVNDGRLLSTFLCDDWFDRSTHFTVRGVSDSGVLYFSSTRQYGLVHMPTGRVLHRGNSTSFMNSFSQDGRFFAIRVDEVGGGPTRIDYWNLKTGEKAWSIPFGPVMGFDYTCHSADGQSLFIVTQNPTYITVVNTRDGTHRFELRGHTGAIWGVASSPDGTHVATCSNDATIRVWSMNDGREIACYRGHSTGARCLIYAPNGWQIISGGMDNTIAAWDFTRERTDGSMLPRLPGYDTEGAYSGGLWMTRDGIAHTLDTHTGQLVSIEPNTYTPRRRVAIEGLKSRGEKSASDFDLTPDGRWLVGPADESDQAPLRLWDAHTGKEVRRFPEIRRRISAAAISADGRYVAATGMYPAANRTIKRDFFLWNAETGAVIRHDALGDYSYSALTFRPHTDELFMGIFSAQTRQSGIRKLSLKHPDKTESVLEGRDGGKSFVRRIIFTQGGHQMAWIDLNHERFGTSIGYRDLTDAGTGWYQPVNMPATGLAFSPDGRRIAMARHDDAMALLDSRDGNEILNKRMPVPRNGDYAYPARVAFSPDGQTLIANTSTAQLSIWQAEGKNEDFEMVTMGKGTIRYREAEQAAYAFHYRSAFRASKDPQAPAFQFHARWLDALKAPNAFMNDQWQKLKLVATAWPAP